MKQKMYAVGAEPTLLKGGFTVFGGCQKGTTAKSVTQELLRNLENPQVQKNDNDVSTYAISPIVFAFFLDKPFLSFLLFVFSELREMLNGVPPAENNEYSKRVLCPGGSTAEASNKNIRLISTLAPCVQAWAKGGQILRPAPPLHHCIT